MGFGTILAAYVLGGITFLPLVAALIFLAGLYSFPVRTDLDTPPLIVPGDETTEIDASKIPQNAKEPSVANTATATSREKGGWQNYEGDMASGYFAVFREYTPSGINARPIERTTPSGSATVAAPSQSIYQAMYRGIFERNKQPPNPVDPSNTVGQRPKKNGNVYYVILRHGHLMLFDDEEQSEVRFVISLLHHDVSIYSGGDEIPEGELFIKKNAIRLTRKAGSIDVPGPDVNMPFYLFAESCSAKEDFYFALLRHQDMILGATEDTPRPLQYETKHLIALVQKVYANEEAHETRWLNALIGRLFLAMYRTKDLEDNIRRKITKKISRIKRPSFLTHILVRGIDLGSSAPVITNPRLRDLNVQGECIIEADIKYTGGARIEIGTTAKVDIASFNKEVTLVLAAVLKRLEGHMLIKIKPPPSDRIWVTFATMPRMEMVIEPVVSSRQITWTVILNQIEHRIREVIAESLVYPFWDDTPFFMTEHKKWRGGIWENDDAVCPPSDVENALAQDGDVDEVEKLEQGGELSAQELDLPSRKDPSQNTSVSDPVALPIPDALRGRSPSGVYSRKPGGRNLVAAKSGATATGTELRSAASTTSLAKPLRTGSFTNAAVPVISTDTASTDMFKRSSSPELSDAASRIAAISSKMQQEESQVGQAGQAGQAVPAAPAVVAAAVAADQSASQSLSVPHSSSVNPISVNHIDSTEAAKLLRSNTNATTTSVLAGSIVEQGDSFGVPPPSSLSSPATKPTSRGIGLGFFNRKDDSQSSISGMVSSVSAAAAAAAAAGDTKKATALSAVSNAAQHARQWGLHALKRADSSKSDADATHFDLSQPMGRGQPLPPPGMPLPMPKKTPTAAVPIIRKSVAPPTAQTVSAKNDQNHHADEGK